MSKKRTFVNVLGTKYEILEHDDFDDLNLDGADGYCDSSNHTIVLRKNMAVDMGDPIAVRKRVMRHEILHAFMAESGMDVCSGSTDCWARHEPMIDFFAIQTPKIWKAWESVNAI